MAFIKRFFQKAISTSDPLLSSMGMTYQNADIAESKAGFALAYQYIVAVQRSIDIRASAINSLDYALSSINDDGEFEQIARSDDRQSRHPFIQTNRRHVREEGRPLIPLIVYALDIWGECYIEVVRSSSGYATGLRWLNPLQVTAYRKGDDITHITYTPRNGGNMVTLLPDEFVYLLNFNPFDMTYGNSPILSSINAINIDRNQKRFLRDFFINNARPSGIIKPPSGGAFSREQTMQFREQFQNFVRGAGNQYTTIASPVDMEYIALEMPDIDKMYSVNEPITREIYASFGVPPSIAGDASVVATYKDGDEVSRRFYLGTIFPIIQRVEEFINASIMPLFDADRDVFFSFDMSQFDTISQQDKTLREQARLDYASGIISFNEVRAISGYDTIDDGDLYLVQGVPVPEKNLAEYWKRQSQSASMPINANDDAWHEGAQLDDGVKQLPTRYEGIDFSVTSAMREEARRGLAWREEHGRGGTQVGVARARDIINRDSLPPQTWRRVKSFFDRHQVSKKAEGFSPGEDGYPSAGRIAWALWGGDAGWSRATSIVSQMNNAEAGKSLSASCECSEPNDQKNVSVSCGCGDGYHHYPIKLWDGYSLKKARSELRAWKKKIITNPNIDFNFEYLLGAPESILMLAHEQYERTNDDTVIESAYKRVMDGHLDAMELLNANIKRVSYGWRGAMKRVNIKSLSDLQNDFEVNFDEWFGQIQEQEEDDGSLDPALLVALLTMLIAEFAYRAFNAGLRESGSPPDDIPMDEYNTMLNQQQGYAKDFVDELMMARQQGKAINIADRIRLWFINSVRPFYALAQRLGAGDPMLKFVGDDGNESCATCQRLKGQVHRLSAWQARGLDPANDQNRVNFECGLWRCEHYLQQVNEPEKGNW